MDRAGREAHRAKPEVGPAQRLSAVWVLAPSRCRGPIALQTPQRCRLRIDAGSTACRLRSERFRHGGPEVRRHGENFDFSRFETDSCDLQECFSKASKSSFLFPFLRASKPPFLRVENLEMSRCQ